MDHRGRLSSGKRIKFIKQGNIFISYKIYSNGRTMVRLSLDPELMEYKLYDPATGYIFESGGNVTNYEVLQRKAKKALAKFLDLYFEKEQREVSQDNE